MSRPENDLVNFALTLARSAGLRLLDFYERELIIRSKSSEFDLVTQADQEAEALVLDQIRARFPDHSLLAEESGASSHLSRYVWVVDPLDGTTNFAQAIPHFSVTIALQVDHETVIGVVYDPLRDECFVAERDSGAWLISPRAGELQLRVRNSRTLGEAILSTGFAYSRGQSPTNNLTEFNRVALRVRGIRRLGSAALDLAYVASGRLDGFWEYHLNPWDTVAGVLLVEEAGGRVTQLSGDPWRPEHSSLATANPVLLPVLRDALNGTDQ